MDAKEFVKRFGWDRAKQILDGKDNYDSVSFSLISAMYIYGDAEGYCKIKDLKTLVDAYEVVNGFGGLNTAKNLHYEDFIIDKSYRDLKKAIQLVESVDEND